MATRPGEANDLPMATGTTPPTLRTLARGPDPELALRIGAAGRAPFDQPATAMAPVLPPLANTDRSRSGPRTGTLRRCSQLRR
jgi:hypothetical protein